MQKPITVAIKGFKEDIVDIVNGSGLPLIVMEPILRDLLEAVREGAEGQEQRDRAEYEASLREGAGQESTDDADTSGMEG